MIDISKLSLSLGGTAVLDDISVTINDGEIAGIIGRSGSGKTLFLECIARRMTSYDGTILVNGAPLPGPARNAGRTLSYCGSAAPQNPDERLRDFLLLARAPYKKALRPFSDYDIQITEENLEAFGLGSYRSATLGILSDGVFKRALIAYTFIRESYAALFDNPTNDLDISSVRSLRRALAHYVMNGNRVALVSSNDLNFIAQTADRIFIMDGGKITRIITPDQLDADVIKEYFGIDVIISRNIYNGRPEVHIFPDA
jgi:ABC-type cobalamin/Fe3+-siderophores transport system ATPase subunit